MQFNIFYDSSDNIPDSKTAGNVYITNDTSEMYVDLSPDLRIQIGDLYIVDSIPPSPLLLNKFYWNQTDSKLYFYNGMWNPLNDINLTQEDIDKVLELGGGIELDNQLNLAIDVVDTIEENNMKPITSNAVYEAINSGSGIKVDVVDKVEEGNMNAISSNAVFEALGDIESALAGI